MAASRTLSQTGATVPHGDQADLSSLELTIFPSLAIDDQAFSFDLLSAASGAGDNDAAPAILTSNATDPPPVTDRQEQHTSEAALQIAASETGHLEQDEYEAKTATLASMQLANFGDAVQPFAGQGAETALQFAGTDDPTIESVIGSDNRTIVSNTTTFPYSAIVKLYSGSTWIGTGALIAPNLVLTAGHVVYDNGSWYSNMSVAPGSNGGSEPYGRANATQLYSWNPWTDHGDINYDIGLIRLSSDIGFTTGWFGWHWQSGADFYDGAFLRTAGYPEDLNSGLSMYQTSGFALRSSNATLLTYTMDTAGGQSGSPLWIGNDIVGVHTNGAGTFNLGTRITEQFSDWIFDTESTRAPTSWQIVGVGDFNANSRSDILWRAGDGQVGAWLMNGTTRTAADTISSAPNSWHIAGTPDFNNDGKDDILWRHDDGRVGGWLLNSLSVTSNNEFGFAPTSWQIQGTGNFNGSGGDDILWRNSGGAVGIWLMNGLGVIAADQIGSASQSWKVQGTGDFNGDGKDDILWRDNGGAVGIWLVNGLSVIAADQVGAAPNGWRIEGTGDFNGDSKDDILWRNDDGRSAVWLMNGLTKIDSPDGPTLNNSWHIVDVGNFDAGTKDDIVWRHDDGRVYFTYDFA